VLCAVAQEEEETAVERPQADDDRHEPVAGGDRCDSDGAVAGKEDASPKAHDRAVEQLADLFRTTHKAKTQQVVKRRGQHCGDVELAGYLANAAGPLPLVLDLRIAHDRFGSSSDPNLNGNLHYPNDIDKSLNDAAADKIRKYRADYNNNPPNAVSFMPAIASTSGRLHSEFIRLLFLQAHRETDRFFGGSGVQSARSTLGASYFHFRRAAYSAQLKSKCG